uniref:Uncharacterized protein n=1 Tax=Fervidicoccus fontis TaxID=683846 RepID=A0A7J3ZL85_9CREN
MDKVSRTQEDAPIFRYGYRLTFVRDSEGQVIGVLVEGPRLPKPLYIPKNPAFSIRARLPETVKRFLRKNGFAIRD